MSNLPTNPKDPAETILKATSGNTPPLMKFKKDAYYVHDAVVPLGTKFLAYCGDWRRGCVKFIGDEKITERIGRVADGFEVPERETLGDMDQSQWELDDDGKPHDPWSRQDYLPVEDIETGDRYLFVTSTNGGRIGLEILCGRWARNNVNDIKKGLPTIKLAIGKFPTKKYGPVPRPDFPVIGWENEGDEPVKPIRPIKPLKTVKTPIKEEGPPENDPDDPGYDLLVLSRDDGDEETPF